MRFWHTQGSGKTLTMVFAGYKLRRQAALRNPTVLIVVDRRDLKTGDVRYHRACVEGAERVDLDGNATGLVTAEQAANSARSIKCIEAKIAQHRHGRAPQAAPVPTPAPPPPPRLTLTALREAAAKRKLAAGGTS
jgi:hypothetical protein